MSRIERRVTRRVAVGATVLGAALLALPPLSSASAEDAEIPLSQQAWFWSTNQQFTACLKDPVLGACQAFVLADGGPRGIAPVPPGTLAPITYGHLGVSMINGISDMRSYLKFDTSAIPEGATVQSFNLRLTISKFSPDHLQYHFDAEGKPPATLNESFAQVQACPMVEGWGIAEGDAPVSFTFQRPELESQSTDIRFRNQRNEPAYDCGLASVRGKLSADGTALEFNLKRIAQLWADAPRDNEGIVLVGVAEGALSTWILELHGAPYSLAPTTPGVPVPVPVPLPEPPEELLQRNHYVSDEEQATATAAFEAPVVEPTDTATPAPVGTTTIIQQVPGPTLTIPGEPAAPAGTTTQVIYALPGDGQMPVGDIATPGWVFLAFPIGLLGLGAMLGAVGKDDLAVGAVPIAGSRVATMLRQRRLDA